MARVRSSTELIVRVSFRAFRPFVPVRLLERSVFRAARLLGFDRGSVGVVVTDDRGISALNRRFTGRSRSTDVLAFDLGSKGRRLLADIVISLTTARRLARSLGIGASEEMMRYIVHGLLHIAGYDDHAPADRAKMWKRQEILLKQVTKSQGHKVTRSQGHKVTRS